jgi:hypothetical protein
VTTCECECKSNGCKYTMTLKKPPANPAAPTPGAEEPPTVGPAPTPEVESVTCDGSCSDGSVDAARFGNGLGNVFGRAIAGATGATGASGSVSTEVKGVCQVIDHDEKSYKKGETGCDCVAETVVKVQ